MKTLISSFLLLCFVHLSALSAAIELCAYFSDNDNSIAVLLDLDLLDVEESEETDKEKDTEGKESGDSDEKEYYAVIANDRGFQAMLNSFEVHYLHLQYSVILNIAGEPPELV
jgi:hypothetical protein